MSQKTNTKKLLNNSIDNYSIDNCTNNINKIIVEITNEYLINNHTDINHRIHCINNNDKIELWFVHQQNKIIDTYDYSIDNNTKNNTNNKEYIINKSNNLVTNIIDIYYNCY